MPVTSAKQGKHLGKAFMKIITIWILIGVLILLVLQAKAAGVVNTCDEASLDAALAGGGTITFACSGTITLTTTKTIAADTLLDGSGQSVTLSGGNTIRLFLVNAGRSLELRSLTISNGNQAFGGAIRNNGTVTIISSTFSNNQGAWGGAILNVTGGVLNVSNSVFSGNSTSTVGGAINNDGTTSITNSTFFNNSAGPGGGAVRTNATGALTISGSVFYNNTANNVAGAIGSDGGPVTIINSTITGNSAPNNSGGFYMNGGTSSITSSTLSNNTAASGANVNVLAGTLTITSSILHNGACTGTLTNGGNNIAFNAAGCPGSSSDPLLGTLGNYGGATQTLPLLVGSAALDAYTTGCPPTDQRGIARPQGAACDIGAYEAMFDVTGDLIVPTLPPPSQCQETLDPAFAAPVGWYCQVLMRDNVWVGYAGTIPAELVNAGVIIAVELIYYDLPGHAVQVVDATHQVCLQGRGRVIFLNSAQAPRQIVELNAVFESGYTCAWITNPGTVVLLYSTER
jgi:hypothetical protein